MRDHGGSEWAPLQLANTAPRPSRSGIRPPPQRDRSICNEPARHSGRQSHVRTALEPSSSGAAPSKQNELTYAVHQDCKAHVWPDAVKGRAFPWRAVQSERKPNAFQKDNIDGRTHGRRHLVLTLALGRLQVKSRAIYHRVVHHVQLVGHLCAEGANSQPGRKCTLRDGTCVGGRSLGS